MCVEAIYVFYVLMSYYYFLDYLVLYTVCIYGVHGGMHDTELLEDRGRGDTVLVVYIFHRRKAVPATKMFVGPGQSSDVEPGGHDEQGQGRTAFHKFMQILGAGVFCGPHRASGYRSSLSFCEFGFVMKRE